MTPYKNLQDLEQTEKYRIFVRIIPFNQDDIEFKWHRDSYDRLIAIKSGSNWYIQFENSLPIQLQIDQKYFIKKDEWHRVIKGTSDLLIEIQEFF